MVRQHVLPFKLESTNDTMTSQAGLVLFGEFLHSLDLNREIDRAFGIPGSGAGYPASAYVLPLLLMPEWRRTEPFGSSDDRAGPRTPVSAWP
jgi:hypothetical protein